MGIEPFAVTLQIKATGTSATCLGCADCALLCVNDIVLANEGGLPAILLSVPVQDNCGIWQVGGCVWTPVKSATWGSVKALYR